MAAIDLILSTASLNHYGLNRVCELARRLEVDGLELQLDDRADTRQVPYLRRLMEEFYLRIPVVHTARPALYPPAESGWAERLAFARTLAREVGARLVVAHPPTRGEARIDFTDAQWTNGIPVAFETMPRHTRKLFGLFSVPDRRWQANAPADWEPLPRLVFDTAHAGTWPDGLAALWRAHGARVAHIHLSNIDAQTWHLPPQQGVLPLEEFLALLAETRYRGCLSLELAPHTLGGHDLDRVAATLAESVSFCRRALVRAFGQRSRRRSHRR